MIRQELAPDLIRGGHRFAEKDHATQREGEQDRFNLKRSGSSAAAAALPPPFSRRRMMRLHPTRRHWSGHPQDLGERASRLIGWVLLTFVAVATLITVFAS
jgi:hypothetical protein